MNKIIVAGGGHGGFMTAILLAKNGFDVSLYEARSEDEMGYNWIDIFDPKPFIDIGIPIYDYLYLRHDVDMDIYDNSFVHKMVFKSKNNRIKMERKEIYKILIKEGILWEHYLK